MIAWCYQYSSGTPNNFIVITIQHWLGPPKWLTYIGHALDPVGSCSWILILLFLSVRLWVSLEQIQIKSPVRGIQLSLSPHLLGPRRAEDPRAALSPSWVSVYSLGRIPAVGSCSLPLVLSVYLGAPSFIILMYVLPCLWLLSVVCMRVLMSYGIFVLCDMFAIWCI